MNTNSMDPRQAQDPLKWHDKTVEAVATALRTLSQAQIDPIPTTANVARYKRTIPALMRLKLMRLYRAYDPNHSGFQIDPAALRQALTWLRFEREQLREAAYKAHLQKRAAYLREYRKVHSRGKLKRY